MTNEFSKTIDASEVATAAAGPAWVKISTRIKGRHIKALAAANKSAARLQTLDPQTASKAEVLEIVNQSESAISDFYRALAVIVLDWNWLDDETGQPLPKPAGNPDVFQDDLDQVQSFWLNQRIGEVLGFRATEGNAPSTKP